MSARPLACLLLLFAVSACEGRPARFADRAPVTDAADRAPVPVPARTDSPPARDLFDAQLRRKIVGALDPERIPDALDVNALDEVPRSTFWDPASAGAERAQPALPLSALAGPTVTGLPGLSVVDARGVRWELRLDETGEQAHRVASAVVSARALRALGYTTPDVVALSLAPGDLVGAPADPRWAMARGPLRVSATRWPLGIDLGPTPLSGRRADDPNDRVPHRDRRTLRALREVFAWLAVGRLDARALRDVYVGAPGRGHVEHVILGFGGALGAGAASPSAEAGLGRTYRSVFVEIGTLGLLPPPAPPPLPAIGAIGETVSGSDYEPTPPWEPLERTSPADAFWIARRMLALSAERIAAIVADAGIDEEDARARLARLLVARRDEVVRRAFAGVTPLVDPRVESGRVLVLRDVAVASGLGEGRPARYRVEVVDDDGWPVTFPQNLEAMRETLLVELPALRGDRAVVRIRAHRGLLTARPVEVHLAVGAGGVRVVGLRH